MKKKKKKSYPNGRCPAVEDRMARTVHSSTRDKRIRVRCSEQPRHGGPHSWHGVPFGTYTRETTASAPCGSTDTTHGRPCGQLVLGGGRCRYHLEPRVRVKRPHRRTRW